jgi:hypothetical protein
MAAASDGPAIGASIELTPMQLEFIQGVDHPSIAAGRDRKGQIAKAQIAKAQIAKAQIAKAQVAKGRVSNDE